jgi:hypothetical protein
LKEWLRELFRDTAAVRIPLREVNGRANYGVYLQVSRRSDLANDIFPLGKLVLWYYGGRRRRAVLAQPRMTASFRSTCAN